MFNSCYSLTLLLLLTMMACQSDQTVKADLSDEKLALIMADLSIVDASVNILTGYTKDSTANVYYRQIFDIHKVTMEQYEQSLRVIVQDLPHFERVQELAEDYFKQRLAEMPSDTTQKK